MGGQLLRLDVECWIGGAATCVRVAIDGTECVRRLLEAVRARAKCAVLTTLYVVRAELETQLYAEDKLSDALEAHETFLRAYCETAGPSTSASIPMQSSPARLPSKRRASQMSAEDLEPQSGVRDVQREQSFCCICLLHLFNWLQ